MSGKRLGYRRVSSADQNPERQLEGQQLDKLFTEYASGTTIKRPVLEALIDYAREDDEIVVHSMDRLARNIKDLRNLIDDLTKRKVSVTFIKENLKFTGEDSPMANLLLNIMGAIAEFERELIRERQLEGIAIAKKAGKYKGTKKKLGRDKIEELKLAMESRKSMSKIAADFGISRTSLYTYLKQIKEN